MNNNNTDNQNNKTNNGGKPPIRTTKFSLIMRVIVSGYLLYTVWSIKDGLFTTTGKEQLLLIFFSVLFLVCAVYLGVTSIKSLAAGEYMVPGEDEQEGAEEDQMDEEVRALSGEGGQDAEEDDPEHKSEAE